MKKYVKCRYCGEENLWASPRCNSCNERLNRICPYCLDKIREFSSKCEHCNKSLEGEAYLHKLVKNYKLPPEWVEWGKEIMERIEKNPEFLKDRPRSKDINKYLAPLSEIYEAYWLREVKEELSHETEIQIFDYKLGEEIKQIRNLDPDKKFPNIFGEDSFHYIDPMELEEYHEEHRDFLYDTLKREKELDPIIVGSKLPDSLSPYINQLRSCYSYGLHLAAIVFCRALIEMALKDALEKRKPPIPEDEKRSVSAIAGKARYEKIINQGVHDSIKLICKEAGEILHEGAKNYSDNKYAKDKSLLLIKETISTLEYIYTGYKKK